jgi:hypothetical protein
VEPAAAGRPGLTATSATAATVDRSADRTSTSWVAGAPKRASGPSADGFYQGPLGPNLAGVRGVCAAVESARLLANQAREELEGDGVSWTEIRRLDDASIAEDRGTELSGFLEWARARIRSGGA